MSWPTSPGEIPDTMPMHRIVEIADGCRQVLAEHLLDAEPVEEVRAAELGALAAEAALADRVRRGRWPGVLRALLAGASVEQVRRAAGLDSEAELVAGLSWWAHQQNRAGLLADADRAIVAELTGGMSTGEQVAGQQAWDRLRRDVERIAPVVARMREAGGLRA